MEELVASIKVAHSNTFLMYFRAHAYHWNVEGLGFPQYHDFFSDLYEDLFGAVDPLAENIRKLGAYAPCSIKDLYNNKTIKEEESETEDIRGMLQSLLSDNEEVTASLNKVFDLAVEHKKQGLANFIADRLDTHDKHGWMLKSCLKGE